jgi:hypothetical protein
MFLIAAVLLSTLFGCGSGEHLIADSVDGSAVATLSIPLRQFQDSLGVNTHINYTDGEYANTAQVYADLSYIGVRFVRDAIPNSSWPDGRAWATLYLFSTNGIAFDFLSNCNAPLAPQLAQLDALVTQYPHVVASVEGQNEINNFPCSTGNGTNEQLAENWQRNLFAAVHSDPNLSAIPVLYMTGAAAKSDLTGYADAANVHPYPYRGVQPYAPIEGNITAAFPGLSSTTQRQITETGYATSLSGNPDAVSESAQASMGMEYLF